MYNEFELNMYYYTIEPYHCLILPEISATIRQPIGNAEKQIPQAVCSSRATVFSEKKEKKINHWTPRWRCARFVLLSREVGQN